MPDQNNPEKIPVYAVTTPSKKSVYDLPTDGQRQESRAEHSKLLTRFGVKRHANARLSILQKTLLLVCMLVFVVLVGFAAALIFRDILAI